MSTGAGSAPALDLLEKQVYRHVRAHPGMPVHVITRALKLSSPFGTGEARVYRALRTLQQHRMVRLRQGRHAVTGRPVEVWDPVDREFWK